MKPSRTSPVPASSTLLMLAIGHEQRQSAGLPILDIWEVAREGGVPLEELEDLLARGEAAGYLTKTEGDVVGLTSKGWAWFRRIALHLDD